MRSEGYYWVRLTYDRDWEVAHFKDGVWSRCGLDIGYQSTDFHEVGPRVIERS